ncbi:TetR/AcrR family transcriptional regulator [Paenibacillus sp. MWE-103]|uniref:TetR/AcrR family transcriptional regulator n=1 Tax=Paenibacillus artemisiicola TaxID=1172618 RepID=A0ABS3WDP1_9BACL|nr:TetR/AcrR family transcriptional regulator [Paenibacillus artemisiicola]MBO7746230.1 TetR/AcrR family transcriptional regulator [Paenibacillus artemisiicola]
MKETRRSILQAAEELLAQRGYAGCSLGMIAERLNVSKGVVTYHFPQKDGIFRELIHGFYEDAAAYMAARLDPNGTAPAVLAAYIEANLRFVAERRVRTQAVMQLIANHRDKDGALVYAGGGDAIYRPLIDIFRYGQDEEKSFRPFAPAMMALFVRSAIDTASGRLAAEADADIEEAVQETVRAFHYATRSVEHEEDPA